MNTLQAGQVVVVYDYMLDESGNPTGSDRAPSSILRSYLGNDFFSNVVRIEFPAGQLPKCGLAPLGGIRGLRHLSLRSTTARDKDIPIDAMPGVRRLDTAFTDITDASVDRLASLKNLKSLDLSGTLITDATLQSVGKISTLEELILQDVALSGRAVEQFKKENPSTSVLWSNAPSRNHLMAVRALSQHLGAVVRFVSKEEATTDIDRFVAPGYRVAISGNSRTSSQWEIALKILAAVEHIEGVSTLELNGFSLNSTDLQWLSKLSTLQSLTLSNAHARYLARLLDGRQLRHLSLRGADTVYYGDRFFRLPQLESLSLQGASTHDKHLSGLERLKKLRQLDLSRTQITDNGMATIGRLEKLEKISLDNTGVTDNGVAEIGHLKSLRQLALSMTEITDAGLATLATIKSLEELVLSFTGVTDAGLARLRGMPHLRELNLCGAYISDKGLECLADIPSLKVLWLIVDGNRVTNAGIHRLQAASPQLQITRLGEVR